MMRTDPFSNKMLGVMIVIVLIVVVGVVWWISYPLDNRPGIEPPDFVVGISINSCDGDEITLETRGFILEIGTELDIFYDDTENKTGKTLRIEEELGGSQVSRQYRTIVTGGLLETGAGYYIEYDVQVSTWSHKLKGFFGC